MNPLRLSLFALIFLAVFSMNNAEADDWEWTLEYVGSYDDNNLTYDIDISGDYAYVVSEEGLSILNIEDPTNPTQTESYYNEEDGCYGEFMSVTISGDYAYVGCEEGLAILNIEDPTNPTQTGSYETEDVNVYDIDISGDYAYVIVHDTENGTGGLLMIDIEDPTNPTLTGSYETDVDDDMLFSVVAISGDYVYISGSLPRCCHHGLVILTTGYAPIAVIDSISPSPAKLGYEISFSGFGEDYDGIIVAYEWESSIDGFLSNEEDFSTTGLSSGDHIIYFRVKNDVGWSDYENETLVVYPNYLPIAVIDSIGPSPAEKGTTVFFNGTSSDSDGTIVAYLWESSIDGELSTEKDFSSNNLSLGRHVITFMVQDNDGDSKTVNQELLIYAFPVAIAGQDSMGTPGVPLQFSGAGTDEDGTVVLYEWDFDGDGIFEWSSTENGRELNIYNNEDTYTATLRVTDNDGFTDTDTVEVTISEKKVQIDDGGNVTVTDAGEDEEGIPSLSFIPALISIGLMAIFRRKN